MNTNTTSNVLLSWSAPERIPVSRGAVWYTAMGILVILAAVYSILTAAWILAVVIVMTSAFYYQHLRSPNAMRTVEIREDGYAINGSLTPWSVCSGFWIYEHAPYFTLHIEKTRGLSTMDVIVFTDIDYKQLAEVISAYLPYRATRRENLLDSIIRFCKL